ncbi:MAG: hypothetical protein ACKO9I_05485 [Sphaerospermopsis kisseleviana]|nr:hypothetical protein [Sphaerospermopsis sp. FACHB-1094]MBD2131165.1 hypothetical protein [Sphaerospermopsis sp. FACHB-1094]
MPSHQSPVPSHLKTAHPQETGGYLMLLIKQKNVSGCHYNEEPIPA